ncbi:MAG: hypothetical protein BMS9Abin37_0744 [Acidobacteriota bacterium]|nr:MAG: hypothetical protein BMS9Abin37_0744 [Acidobacteriota bacterium]
MQPTTTIRQQYDADDKLESAAFSAFVLRGLHEDQAKEAAALLTSFVWLLSTVLAKEKAVRQ